MSELPQENHLPSVDSQQRADILRRLGVLKGTPESAAQDQGIVNRLVSVYSEAEVQHAIEGMEEERRNLVLSLLGNIPL